MTTPNRSFVSQLNYNLVINRLPNVNFDVQAVNIPGLTLGHADQPTPFVKIPWPGDHLDFSDLMISFKLNEDFTNWVEIFRWMTGLGFPRAFKQYGDLKRGVDKSLAGLALVPSKLAETNRKIGNIFSQITLTVLTSHNNPFIQVDFVDAFPVELGPIEFRTTDAQVDFITVKAFFKYTSYDVRLP